MKQMSPDISSMFLNIHALMKGFEFIYPFSERLFGYFIFFLFFFCFALKNNLDDILEKVMKNNLDVFFMVYAN
jgi:hypothetical protein